MKIAIGVIRLTVSYRIDSLEKSIDRIANSERVSYRINSLESNEQLESKCSRASYRIDR